MNDRRSWTTTFSNSLLKRLKIQAAKEDRNINDILEELAEKYLAKKEKQN